MEFYSSGVELENAAVFGLIENCCIRYARMRILSMKSGSRKRGPAYWEVGHDDLDRLVTFRRNTSYQLYCTVEQVLFVYRDL